MTYFIFVGDMLVMLFMIGVAIWVSLASSQKTLEQAARIPLQDENRDG